MAPERRSRRFGEGQQPFGGGLNAPEPRPPQPRPAQGGGEVTLPNAAPPEGLSADDLITRIRVWNDPHVPPPGSCIFGRGIAPLIHRQSSGGESVD